MTKQNQKHKLLKSIDPNDHTFCTLKRYNCSIESSFFLPPFNTTISKCTHTHQCTPYQNPNQVASYPKGLSNRKPDQFCCKSDPNYCIESWHVCDGVFDCFDRSDEMDCPLATNTRTKKDEIAANKLAKIIGLLNVKKKHTHTFTKSQHARSLNMRFQAHIESITQILSLSLITLNRSLYIHTQIILNLVYLQDISSFITFARKNSRNLENFKTTKTFNPVRFI